MYTNSMTLILARVEWTPVRQGTLIGGFVKILKYIWWEINFYVIIIRLIYSKSLGFECDK